MKVAIVTFGCRVNQYESEAMAEELEVRGFVLVPPEEAHIVIINTCVVTHRAEADSRKALHRAKRRGQKAVVVGCWPQLDPEAPLGLGAEAVVGNDRKDRIAEVLRRVIQGEVVSEVGGLGPKFRHLRLGRPRFHTRALLKIQEGCDARCTYCVVPLVRGPSRSLRPEEVLRALESFAEEGVVEVVLTGVNLGRWGRDLGGGMDLAGLLREIEKAPSPPRIRLSSIEPQEVTPELIETVASSRKLCPHLHLPLQSGSDEVLEAMGRPYRVRDFRGLVLRIKEAIADCAIGTDVIVGFPTEDEEAFHETQRLIEELPLSYLHVFPFSPRPGTAAARLADSVPEKLKRERVQVLRELGRGKREAFIKGFVGRRLQVLVEGRKQEGFLTGLSRNYIRCLLQGDAPVGREVEVRVVDVQGERALCQVLKDQEAHPHKGGDEQGVEDV